MNIWEIILNVIGWIVLALIIVTVVVFVGAVIDSLIKRHKKAKATKLAPGKKPLSDDAIIQIASDQANDQFKGDILFYPMKRDAYMSGVEFGLLARKDHPHADRI